MRRSIMLAAGLVVAGSSARAQSGAERAALEELRAELAAITDSMELLERERAGIAAARIDRDNPMRHLELGFVGYRLGEVTEGHQHYNDAAGEFEWASELAPEWPYAWYGLGLAELALGEHNVLAIENIRQVLGLDYLSKAADAFARAATVDPSFVQGVVDLAETAMKQRINARLDVALNALRGATATAAAEVASVQLARGQVERLSGEGDSALAAFEAFVRVGGDSALGLLEQARTLFFLRRTREAQRRYYLAAAHMGHGEARALLRSDLSWIASDEELTTFDGLADTAVHSWVQRFWRDRSAQSARRPGDRLPEHYRRFFYALRHYSLVSQHRRYDPSDAYRSDQALLDDRGIIYVRHGEPDRRAQFLSLSLEPNESWLYERPDDDLVFHFVARGDVQDYKLVESLLDVYGLGAAITMQATGQRAGEVSDLFNSRATFGAVYRRLGAGGSSGSATDLATERHRGRTSVRVGTSTDSYPLRFPRPLEPSVQVYALGGTHDEDARLLVVFAIPARTLAGQRLGQGVVYPLAVRVVSPTGEDGRGVFLDTTRAFVTERELEGEDHLAGFVEVPVGPGLRDVRVVLADPSGEAGDVVDVDSVAVPPFGSGTFVLSDLVLGEVGSSLTWPVGRDTIPLSPLAQYPQHAEMELYYEVHGLDAGTHYRARIEVQGKRSNSIFARIGRLFGGGGPPVSFEFEGIATGLVTRARQTVDLEALDEGEYRVELTVEEPSRDVRHTREARFRVRSK